MQHLEDSIHIDAALDDVFAFITDPTHAPEWIPSLVEVSNIRGEGANATYDWVFKMAGIRMAGKTRVTESEKNKRYEHRSEGAITSTWHYELDRHSGQTRVRLEIDYDIPTRVGKKIAEKILLRQHQREMKLALNALKEIVEFESGRNIAAE
jgi:uncharacterized membrane protein